MSPRRPAQHKVLLVTASLAMATVSCRGCLDNRCCDPTELGNACGFDMQNGAYLIHVTTQCEEQKVLTGNVHGAWIEREGDCEPIRCNTQVNTGDIAHDGAGGLFFVNLDDASASPTVSWNPGPGVAAEFTIAASEMNPDGKYPSAHGPLFGALVVWDKFSASPSCVDVDITRPDAPPIDIHVAYRDEQGNVLPCPPPDAGLIPDATAWRRDAARPDTNYNLQDAGAGE